jgi:hypothetical protein
MYEWGDTQALPYAEMFACTIYPVSPALNRRPLRDGKHPELQQQ